MPGEIFGLCLVWWRSCEFSVTWVIFSWCVVCPGPPTPAAALGFGVVISQAGLCEDRHLRFVWWVVFRPSYARRLNVSLHESRLLAIPPPRRPTAFSLAPLGSVASSHRPLVFPPPQPHQSLYACVYLVTVNLGGVDCSTVSLLSLPLIVLRVRWNIGLGRAVFGARERTRQLGHLNRQPVCDRHPK